MGLTSLVKGLWNDWTGTTAARETNAANLESVKSTNATNKEIAAKNNEMQIAMNRENNQFNRDMALEMFNLENAYNSPANQKKLIEASEVYCIPP